MNAVMMATTVTPMPTALTQMAAITAAVWMALREMGQCVKVCSFLSHWNGYNTYDIFGRY